MSSVPRELVDEEALESYLGPRLPGRGPFVVERHQAGHSNESFYVSRGPHRWVLRRPPLGAFLPSAHDVLREHRIMSALESTPVRVPKMVLACEDASIIGAPFYLMERVDGVVIREELPEVFSPAHRPAIGTELIDALVELHEVDFSACGLAGLAKPTGYLQRQLKRWSGQLELTVPYTRPLPELERAGCWLQDNLPASSETTLVHGDYKLDNVMFGEDAPARLVAILDWEMATLGDPLADLGWMTSFWHDPTDAVTSDVFARTSRVTALEGFLSRSDLIQRYAARTGRTIDHLSWYQVLAIWKLAILLEGSYARHLGGMTDDPFFAEMERGVPELASRALEVAYR